MKLVTVVFAAFAYICSSSLSVGAQICTLNEFQSKYNQTSLYDIFDEFKSTRINEINCTTGKKIGTIDIEAQGNKWIISPSDENYETYTCENKEAFKGLTLAEYLENNNAIESSYINIIIGCYFGIWAILFYCNCPTQAQCENLGNISFTTCEDLNTNDTSEEDEKLSVGAIVGIAVGSFVFLVGVILLVYRYRKGKWPWQSSEEAEVGPILVVKNLIF